MTTPTRTLVVLRHARAEAATGVDDQLRPLALDGRKQATALGRQMHAAGLAPELVLCSSALRTRQTWELTALGLAGLRPDVEFRDELYVATPTDMLAAIQAVDESVATILLVGHEPSVSALSAYLAGPESDDAALAQVRVGVPTATYAILSGDDSWAAWGQRTAKLAGVFRPGA